MVHLMLRLLLLVLSFSWERCWLSFFDRRGRFRISPLAWWRRGESICDYSSADAEGCLIAFAVLFLRGKTECMHLCSYLILVILEQQLLVFFLGSGTDVLVCRVEGDS